MIHFGNVIKALYNSLQLCPRFLPNIKLDILSTY